ncbi:putative ion channel [Phlyctema vagabunda]|uniref:Ion channel n=1 Tax=Phlyctema vagabunda TaxID=108571 RepID=A0ABR4P888_9HELO
MAEDEESREQRIPLLTALSSSREDLMHAGGEAGKRAQRAWDGFQDFALQDNVLEVAVGLILAAAFTTVVTSFVSEILLPPLSLLPFINRNLDEKFAVLRKGPHYIPDDPHRGYNTLKQALDDGAVVLAYGTFLNKLLNFVGMGLVLYFIASLYEWISNDSIIKLTIKCRYCRKRISQKALRCVNCTSWQDGREERMH